MTDGVAEQCSYIPAFNADATTAAEVYIFDDSILSIHSLSSEARCLPCEPTILDQLSIIIIVIFMIVIVIIIIITFNIGKSLPFLFFFKVFHVVFFHEYRL